ncbi:MAG: M50 family metallopeptidase [Coriobacteriia bacterium]|nr:M50 family metallopeptidase [Coriobacteriia bacterium]
MEMVFEGIKVVFFGALMFSIIVTIHELGHFTTARLFGLRVKEFMIGLPGPNIGFHFKGTKFGVTPFLLGGYALIAGGAGMKENTHLASAFSYLAQHGTLTEEQALVAEAELGYDLEEALDVLHDWGTIKRVKKKGRYTYLMPQTMFIAEGQPRQVEDAQAHITAERKLTYDAAPWYRRVIILAGGVIFNLIFAIIIFTSGMMLMGAQEPTTTFESVVAGSPAELAGIQPGDTIVSFEGQPIDTWEAFTTCIAAHKPGDQVTVCIDHQGDLRDLRVVLADNEGRPMLGVTTSLEKRPVPFSEAFTTSVGFIGLVTQAILKLFNPATFNEVISESTSIVGISFEARNFAAEGFLPFIYLAAALSISIGLMNLLPFPPLDGGKIIVETIERVTRRKIPSSVMSGISVTALALLVLLFLYVTNQDIHRYILGG